MDRFVESTFRVSAIEHIRAFRSLMVSLSRLGPQGIGTKCDLVLLDFFVAFSSTPAVVGFLRLQPCQAWAWFRLPPELSHKQQERQR